MTAQADSKPQTIQTFDGRTVDGEEAADHFDPDCRVCDMGVVTRAVPVSRGSSATAARTDVCACAINRWQAAHPKEVQRDGQTSTNPA